MLVDHLENDREFPRRKLPYEVQKRTHRSDRMWVPNCASKQPSSARLLALMQPKLQIPLRSLIALQYSIRNDPFQPHRVHGEPPAEAEQMERRQRVQRPKWLSNTRSSPAYPRGGGSSQGCFKIYKTRRLDRSQEDPPSRTMWNG